MTDAEQLVKLLGAQHACVTITTYEEAYAVGVVREAAARMSGDVWIWTATDGVRDGLVQGTPPIKDTEHPAAALYYLAHRLDKPGICVMLDLVDHLEDRKVLRLLRELIQHIALAAPGAPLVLIDHRERFPEAIAAHSTRMELSLPDEKELEQMIRDTLRRLNREERIQVDLTRGQLGTIVRNLRGLTRRQAEEIIIDAVASDRRFDEQDINTMLARKRQAVQSGGLLEYVEAPVSLDQIGGIRRLKAWLRQRQAAMSAKAAEFGIEAPRGVLMLGVQGAGKSLCAKAIASAWGRPLLRMDPGALYDRYVGESERRLRDALRQAEMMAPIVLWIDEIEKAFASAASHSTDGGLSQRMFATLLTWMQEHRSPVFLVATANDIEALPPELLRKGRFDEIFFVDLPDEEVRAQIFAIHLCKRRRDPTSFDVAALARACEGYSGAEIEQAVVSALHDAFSAGHELTTGHLLAALRNSPPLSVTMSERIAALRLWAHGRTVPAD